MDLYKDGKVLDYDEVDKVLAKELTAPYNNNTFAIIPNRGAYKYLNTMDWFEILNQAFEEAGALSRAEIVEYYTYQYDSLMEIESKKIEDLIPQLFEILDFLDKHLITAK
tara:strand:- start:54293 stop:54622 length:330 start_codon:yes stop_codon:yes gene_type:complete